MLFVGASYGHYPSMTVPRRLHLWAMRNMRLLMYIFSAPGLSSASSVGAAFQRAVIRQCWTSLSKTVLDQPFRQQGWTSLSDSSAGPGLSDSSVGPGLSDSSGCSSYTGTCQAACREIICGPSRASYLLTWMFGLLEDRGRTPGWQVSLPPIQRT